LARALQVTDAVHTADGAVNGRWSGEVLLRTEGAEVFLRAFA
jgi:hypothetical protein